MDNNELNFKIADLYSKIIINRESYKESVNVINNRISEILTFLADHEYYHRIIIDMLLREIGKSERQSNHFGEWTIINNDIYKCGHIFSDLPENELLSLYDKRDRLELDLFKAMFADYKFFQDKESAQLFIELGGPTNETD